MNNGSGLRVVLWLSGCDHKCKGCQNPQTWDANSGISFDEKAKEELFRELDKDYISGLTLTGGDPLHPSNLDGVLDIVTEFNKRYKTTQDIVLNREDNHNMLNENGNKIRLSLPQKTIWLYTGYRYEEIVNEHSKWLDSITDETSICNLSEEDFILWQRYTIVKNVDVLVDGRYVDKLRDATLKWKGSSNQRVIDVQQTLKKGEIILWAT